MDKEKKKGRYERLYIQIKDLIEKTQDDSAKMATICAVLHHKMNDFFWTGFYLIKDGDLIVHTYQGPVACIKLKRDTGVCWAGINQKKSIVVPDVEQFPGHIACDSRSKSEIVVPVYNRANEITGVLDVDSDKLNTFDEIDKVGLERIISLLV